MPPLACSVTLTKTQNVTQNGVEADINLPLQTSNICKSRTKILVTNRVAWEVTRILRVYRHRWTGTETFHRDGKQELGMGGCQLRDGQGQTRHMYLVMLAYSLLMRQLQQSRAKEWAFRRLTTIGEACRAVLNETLRTTLEWAIRHAADNPHKAQHITAILGLT